MNFEISQIPLPEGVKIHQLQPRPDSRGILIEIFRAEWLYSTPMLQWNTVKTLPNTLRGFHVHLNHCDYLHLIEGVMFLGLKDMRRHSPTFDRISLLSLDSECPIAIEIPPGVGHGFCFTQKATYVYATSEYWSADDELGCMWNDPDLGIDWPLANPILSERDQTAKSLTRLQIKLDIHFKHNQ